MNEVEIKVKDEDLRRGAEAGMDEFLNVFIHKYLEVTGGVINAETMLDQWDLRNRYLHLTPSSEWKNQPNLAETRETGQARDKVHTDNPEIERLVAVIGKEQMSVKMMMEKLQLKGRDNLFCVNFRLFMHPWHLRCIWPHLHCICHPHL